MTVQLLLTLLMQQGRVAVGGFTPSCRFFFEKRGWIGLKILCGPGEAGKLMEQGLFFVMFFNCSMGEKQVSRSRPTGLVTL